MRPSGLKLRHCESSHKLHLLPWDFTHPYTYLFKQSCTYQHEYKEGHDACVCNGKLQVHVMGMQYTPTYVTYIRTKKQLSRRIGVFRTCSLVVSRINSNCRQKNKDGCSVRSAVAAAIILPPSLHVNGNVYYGRL